LKGGSYGELRELFDVDEDDPDAPTRPVMPTDAVLSDFRVLFVIPPYGLSGLIIVETRSRSHLTGQAIRQINSQLMRHGVWLRTRREITDAAAWQQYLSAGNVGVKAVELIQTTQSADRTSFTSENVKRTHVQIDLYDGPHWPAA
jgi:hypothetical protein